MISPESCWDLQPRERPKEDFLSVEEVAKRLGLKEETIRTYIREGSLDAYRFGNVLRVRVDDFEKFVEERKIRRDEDK